MIPAAQIQTWAESVTPIHLAAVPVAGVVLLTVLFGLWRARRSLPDALPTLVFLAAGMASLDMADRRSALAPPPRVWVFAAIAALAWLADVVRRWRRRGLHRAAPVAAVPVADPVDAYAPRAEDPFGAEAETVFPVAPPPPPPPRRLSLPLRFVLAVTFAVAAVLLFDHLGDYAGTLVHWESPVVADGFAEAFRANTGLLEYARERTLWDNGILSRGDTSLFFGLPTYALLRWFGFHTWTLRVMSVVATLLTIWLFYVFGRRFFSPRVGVAAAVFFALSSPAMYYGRYGSSIAGTLLAVMLALYAVWAFLDRPRAAWWLGAVCALALYVATLQYAPARLFVLFTLAYLPLALALNRAALRWQSLIGLLLIAVAAFGVYRYQQVHHTDGFLLHARGEQFFDFVENPNSIQALAGINASDIPRDAPDWRKGIMIMRRLLAVTVPQCLQLIAPRPAVRGGGRIVLFDPPDMPLYFAPLLLLIALGIAFSLPRWRSWRHLFLLAFPVAYAVPLLLTNRVDMHRGILLLIPVTLWAALGAREVARMMSRATVPRSVQFLAVLPVAVALVYADVVLRYPYAFPDATTAKALNDHLAAIPGSVALGLVFDHRDRNWVELQLLERRRTHPDDRSLVAPDAMVNALRADRGGPRPAGLEQAEQLARRGTLILGPSQYFRGVVGLLQERGLRAAEERIAGVIFLRFDRGAGATGVADDTLNVLPEVYVQPTPTPPRRRRGRKIWLTDLQPRAVAFGFAEPKINQTWNGQQVVMGGVPYERAIGTHAWTRMTYEVPPNAVVFESMVGLSDSILGCARASVVFEVRDTANHLLAATSTMDVRSEPRLLVARLHGEKEIVLSVTEAGDGRDCDHANWGAPAFVVGRPDRRSTVQVPSSNPTPSPPVP